MKYPKGHLSEPNQENPVLFSKEDLACNSLDKLKVCQKESIFPRADGEFRNRGFYLSQEFDWKIIEDDKGGIVLLPLRRKYKE